MTPREILTMYARVWGLPENSIRPYVDNLLEMLYLQPQAEKFIYTLRWDHVLLLPLRPYSDISHVWDLTAVGWIAACLNKLRNRQARAGVLRCSSAIKQTLGASHLFLFFFFLMINSQAWSNLNSSQWTRQMSVSLPALLCSLSPHKGQGWGSLCCSGWLPCSSYVRKSQGTTRIRVWI